MGRDEEGGVEEGKKGSYFLSPSRKQLLVLGRDEAGG